MKSSGGPLEGAVADDPLDVEPREDAHGQEQETTVLGPQSLHPDGAGERPVLRGSTEQEMQSRDVHRLHGEEHTDHGRALA
jgi:hypothetical protein